MGNSAIPPTPTPWPVGPRQPTAPGVGDFLCQMVRELRALRTSGGNLGTLVYTESQVQLNGNQVFQIVPYSSRRRYLLIFFTATNLWLSTKPDQQAGSGYFMLGGANLFREETWAQHGALVQQAHYCFFNGVATVYVLTGDLPQ